MQQGAGEKGRVWDLSEQVIGACIRVHRELGPGLLESAYERCLAHELSSLRLTFDQQRAVPVSYKGVNLECGYRVDFAIEGEIILEIKAVDQLLPVHIAQVLTFLKLTGIRTGLLVNFNAEKVKQGIRRLTLKKSLPISPAPCLPPLDRPERPSGSGRR
jgi:GxxExxY protein